MKPVKLSFAQRKKHMTAMIKKSHYFKAQSEALSPKKVSKTVEKKKEPKSSWLDGLVQQYCREQHRQCSHPVSIVPPFSLSSTAPHICPDVSAPSLVSNIHNRLVTRSAFGNSTKVDLNTTRFVYSRHRAFRVVGHGSDLLGSLTSARFLGPPNDLDLLIGTDRGELCRLNLEQDTIVGTWQCHNDAGPLTSISTNEHTRMLFSNSNPLVLTGTHRLNQYEQAVIGLWDLGHVETPRWTLAGMRSGQFNFTGDRIVAMSYASENQFDPSLSSPIRGTGIYEVETGTLLTQMDTRANTYGDDTNCAFSPCDTMVLADGMLWDLRVSKSLHQFDKLSNFGYGFFHPAGNEVIINSAVWDLRTFKLLRLVPSLEQCRVQFNQAGSILYAYSPFEPVMKETSKKALKQKTWFRVLDARDYKDISTVDVERPIYDMSLNSQETLLSIVEGRYLDSVYGEDDPVCRLYEIGRSKPNEADSDLEDNVEESDSMDDFEDESNSSGDEENEDDNSASVDENSQYSASDSSQEYDTDYDELFPVDGDVMRLEIPDNAYLTFGSEYDEDDEEDDSGESSTSEEED
ncbi:hypothetical protein THRCLA_10623 [Thraustotheca clavata]|uniref:Uncharacterized protein n=1 Tax=Thraustotheca clavata TaxID=74557 RepID=A0A1V9YJL3_9STRA|nr:hypothetical protein THRCLA_10623 [Thraustotheca clavata]